MLGRLLCLLGLHREDEANRGNNRNTGENWIAVVCLRGCGWTTTVEVD